MLNQEQAQAELKKLKDEKWMTARLTASASLPTALRDTARTILGADKARSPRVQPDAHFRQMDEAARVQFFEAMAPGLGRAIERGWQLLDRLPYQGGYARKPFRAPNHPDALIGRRVNWVLQLLSTLGPYRQNLAWFAAWAPHVAYHYASDNLGILFAAAIDAGGAEGEEIFQILCASGRNEHEIGAMGRHVTRALMCASRPDGWEFVEKMLLAAQREEGLRQTILETIDEAHPEAFRRMLKLILDQNLSRFSSTVRAFDVWLGYQWDAVSAGVVNATIEKMLLYLEDKAAREMALKGKDAEQVYLALWSQAFDDAIAAVTPAAELLKHPGVEHRFVATHFLTQLGLVASQKHLLSSLEDADLRVATRAVMVLSHGADPRIKKLDLFERFEKLVPRFPAKEEKLKAIIWPWTEFTVSRELPADALNHNLGERPPTRLIPHLDQMSAGGRSSVIHHLAAQEKWDAATRDTLFSLVGDPSRNIRETALKHLAKCELTPVEADGIEKLLDRKSSDLRRGSLTLLTKQPDAAVLASADRLLAAKSSTQRVAGLELLRLMAEGKRCADAARARMETYVAEHPTLADAEQQHVNAVMAVGGGGIVAKLDDALGLIRHENRTWAQPPRGVPVQSSAAKIVGALGKLFKSAPAAPAPRAVQFHSPAAPRIVAALQQLFKDNAQQSVTIKTVAGETWKGLLSDLSYNLGDPNPKLTAAEDRERFPLADVWEKWWADRGPEFRDADGMELLRALTWFHFTGQRMGGSQEMTKQYPEAIKTIFGDDTALDEKRVWSVRAILHWLLRFNPPEGCLEFSFEAAESAFGLVPADAWKMTAKEAVELKDFQNLAGNPVQRDWRAVQEQAQRIRAKTNWRRTESPYGAWLKTVQVIQLFAPQLWNQSHHNRHWNLLRWLDQPVRPQECGGDSGVTMECCLPRERADIFSLCRAHGEGGSTEADIIEQLIGQRGSNGHYGRHGFDDLRQVSRRKVRAELTEFKFLTPLMERCRKRIFEIELARGDTPTAASMPALSLSSVEGIANLMGILRALGKRNFVRGWAPDNQSIETVMSHLARCSFPLADETAAEFAEQMKEAGISEDRLVELAVYAPQWAHFTEQALGWEMFTEGVWWIHAHTKGMDWTVDAEIRELWQADMNSRTSLSAEDLLEGGVDVAWFHRISKALGATKWEAIYEAAKFASTGGGHARARLFADAMLGEVSQKELVERIEKKRHQDTVRALGLLPLAAGKKKEADLLDRYKVIQEFRRSSKQFGSQRQASEKRAAQIGQQNLARTAGYADPIRLEWAMEAKAVEDLGDGPIEVLVEDVKVSLGIDPWGEIELSVVKDGKTLADIPAKLKKNPEIDALRKRKVELKRQASRIRPSLELFMVRGDEFTCAELCQLMGHPLLAPMLKNLVIIGDGIAGYPVHEGKALENHSGTIEAIKADEKLRIAHPHDLLPAAAWHLWQKDCFARERIQPFKQVFRELYPLTETEKAEGRQTRRYAGHQVQPRQALALLGQRGWVHHPEEGIRKVFHDAGLVAWLHFQEAFNTPAEIEGLTLEGVFFTKRGESEAIKLEQLPPRLFSETMRDLDLVVSVAHRGGVDPEASASTIEMRSTLVQETTRLLKLTNVELKDRYALIKGALGEYSVHLGSGVTRKMPGESLFIVAVHSQHRGRLFLPFADDDPRSAEVMSKVLLLARDKEIKDPTILDQIRHV